MITKMRRWLAVVVMVIAALGMSSTATPAAAQQPTSQPPSEIEMYGTISAIAGKLITVNGFAVDTTKAEIKGALTVGTLVRVEGVLSASGITAREVQVSIRIPRAGLFEISGLLTSLNNTTGVVAGITVDLANAQFYRGVQVGAMVKVEGRFNAAGILAVREIKPFTAALDRRSSDDDSSDDSKDDKSSDDSSDDSKGDDKGGDDHGGDDHKGGDDKGGDDKGGDDKGGDH